MYAEQTEKPTLIYFKTRGNAQIIRCVLLEIGVDFNQKFIPFKEPVDPAILKEHKIEIKNLPYFIHNNMTIMGVFPIIKYCCTYYNRLDLLGKTQYEQLKISEFMVKAYRQKGIMLHLLFKHLKEMQDKSNIKEGMSKLIRKMIEVDQSTKLMSTLKSMFQNTKKFLFGYLTVADFFYYEKVFHGINMIADFIVEEPHREMIQVEKEYKNFFESTQFFKKHQQRLSQYKVFFTEIDCKLNQIIRELWRGDPKFVTD